jgi:hypothetical protein
LPKIQFSDGISQLQTNILELRPSSPPFHRYNLDERGRVLELQDIVAAAKAIERQTQQQNLRVMVWHDLGTLEPMLDAAGDPLTSLIHGDVVGRLPARA